MFPQIARQTAGVCFLLVCHVSPGATLFVGPNGNDTSPGTETAPLHSIQKAADLAKAGTTVILEDGTYELGLVIRPAGTAEAPIVFQARHPRKAVVSGPSPGAHSQRQNGIEIRGNYVVLDGLAVKDAPGTGVKVNGRHVTLRHCLLHHNGWKIAGDAFGGAGMTTSGDAHDLLLEDNESYENREHGFYVSGGADRPIIRRNKLHDNGDPQRNLGGNGLQINADGGNWPTDDAIIEANIIHGNRSNGISLQGACGSLLVNNLLFDNHKGDIGISKGSSNDRLVNNTIVAGPRGGPCIRISAGGNHGPCRNIALRNNILVADQGRSFCYALEGGVAALSDSDYNLLWAGKDRLVGLEVGKRLTFDECRATGIEKHSLAADPQFRDPAKGDFRLKDTSPAVGAGQAEAGVAADLEGVKRKRGPACDLGAFELAQPR